MKYTTKAEKELVAATVNKYIHSGYSLTIQRYTRVVSWSNGMTLQDIATEEGVTHQAVGQTVREDFKKILDFAKLKH